MATAQAVSTGRLLDLLEGEIAELENDIRKGNPANIIRALGRVEGTDNTLTEIGVHIPGLLVRRISQAQRAAHASIRLTRRAAR